MIMSPTSFYAIPLPCKRPYVVGDVFFARFLLRKGLRYLLYSTPILGLCATDSQLIQISHDLFKGS